MKDEVKTKLARPAAYILFVSKCFLLEPAVKHPPRSVHRVFAKHPTHNKRRRQNEPDKSHRPAHHFDRRASIAEAELVVIGQQQCALPGVASTA
jgi:hypothetical protein